MVTMNRGSDSYDLKKRIPFGKKAVDDSDLETFADPMSRAWRFSENEGSSVLQDLEMHEIGPSAADYQPSDCNAMSESRPLIESSMSIKDEILLSDSEEGTSEQSAAASEGSLSIAVQVSGPYLIAGLGMVAAGLVLDDVQHWPVFVNVPEVFILVPALLGLKGNLEMTLASRLSTQANLGNVDSSAEQFKLSVGNLILTQAQAIVVGLLASVAAIVFGWIPDGSFSFRHALLLASSSMLTASLASLILGTIMILVVLLSRKCNINPDNVATPIAASLGDLTTLLLLSRISAQFYTGLHAGVYWPSALIFLTLLALTPVWMVFAYRNKFTHDVVQTGWVPIIAAMVISSIGGLILDTAVSRFKGIAVFQPVINGVGGNLVAVQASRLSTALHRSGSPVGQLPAGVTAACPNPLRVFLGSDLSARTARVLLLLVIPGHLVFIYTISYLNAGHTSITVMFAAAYLCAALLQVFFLLYIVRWLVNLLWKCANDPDNYSIPYLTALGDLLGTAFLALAFLFLYWVGDRDQDVGE